MSRFDMVRRPRTRAADLLTSEPPRARTRSIDLAEFRQSGLTRGDEQWTPSASTGVRMLRSQVVHFTPVVHPPALTAAHFDASVSRCAESSGLGATRIFGHFARSRDGIESAVSNLQVGEKRGQLGTVAQKTPLNSRGGSQHDQKFAP